MSRHDTIQGNPESRGERVEATIHAYFGRHGEKETSPTTPDTPLSERGKERSAAVGRARPRRGVIKAYVSPTERTRDTGSEIVQNSPTDEKRIQRERNVLAPHIDPDGAFLREAMRIKAETLGPDYAKLPLDELQQRLRMSDARQTDLYLSYGERRPDPKTDSPVEAASRIAHRLYQCQRMAGRVAAGTDADLIHTTHDFSLASFLHEVMMRRVDNKDVRGFVDIDEIGGPIDFNESFEVAIERLQDQSIRQRLTFRGQEYPIDHMRFEELVRIGEALTQEDKNK